MEGLTIEQLEMILTRLLGRVKIELKDDAIFVQIRDYRITNSGFVQEN